MSTELKKGVFGIQSLKAYIDSPTCNGLLDFLGRIIAAAKGKDNGATSKEAVQPIIDALDKLRKVVDEVEPLEQSSRFGNKSYRVFIDKMRETSHEHVGGICTGLGLEAAVVDELCGYWERSFGDQTRIDYGTGHEATFLMFLFALAKAGVVKVEGEAGDTTLGGIALCVFPRYLSLVRHIQGRYRLEPAGSHGVWSLDDYQFLPFVIGSAQMDKSPSDPAYRAPDFVKGLRTSDAGSVGTNNLFSEAILHILRVKTGRLEDHSPILNDILGLKSWQVINHGLLLLFKAEVLGKFPVAQHFVFGSLLPVTWQVEDHGENARPNPFQMAQLQQSVVPGVNPQGTDVLSKYFLTGAKSPVHRVGLSVPGRPAEAPSSANQPVYSLLDQDSGIEISDWAINSNVTRIASEEEFAEIVKEHPWATFPPPEMFFAENRLSLAHKRSGVEVRFSPLEALRGCLIPVGEDGQPRPDRVTFKVVHAKKWSERSDVNGNTIQQWRHDFDWTYTTLHGGSITTQGGEPATLEPTETGIDYERLKVREPILWYKEVVLFEDDLFDSGITQYSVKIRVMPSGWFVLCRFWLRVDDTYIRLFDTRYAHFYEESFVTVERCKKEASYEDLKRHGRPSDNKQLIDPNVVSNLLPEVEKEAFRVAL